MWLLKLPLDQNLIVIYHKFNNNFKSHINFNEIKKNTKIICNINVPNGDEKSEQSRLSC
jgi:hypothetical protein